MANVNLGIQVLWTGNNVEANLEGVETRLEELQRSVDRLGDMFERMGRRAARAGQDGFLGLSKLGRQLSSITRAARLAQIAFVGLIGGAIAALGGAVIQAAGQYQRFIAQLTLTEGSGSAARQTLFAMSREFVSMGANVEAGIAMFVRFRLAGIEAASQLTNSLIGLSTTMGLTKEQTHRVTLAIGQMFAKGQFVRAEEFSQQLQETLPLATRAAAEGFRRMGREGLDSVQEISRAVTEGTLRVQDFTDAIILGSDAFINRAAAITNIQTQWEGLVSVVKIAIGATGQMNGVTAALAIVMNTVSQAIIDWMASWNQMSPEDQAKQVRAIALQIIDFIAGIEATIRAVTALGKIFIGFFVGVFKGLQMLVAGIAGVGATVAGFLLGLLGRGWDRMNAAVRGTRRTVMQFGQDAFNSFQMAVEGAQDMGRAFDTPLADNLRRRVEALDIENLLAEAGRGTPAQGQGDASQAAQRDRAAEARANRLIELNENLLRLQEQVGQATRQTMSPLERAMESARDPFDQLINRLGDLRTDFEALQRAGQPVGDALDQIAEATNRLGEASDVAADRARRLYEMQERIAQLRNSAAISEVFNNVTDLTERVQVRFEGGGTAQIREEERRLFAMREQNVIRMAEIEAQIQEAQNANHEEEVVRLQALLAAHATYQTSLEGITGAMLVAAARMQELVGEIRSAVEGAVTDLIVGLVEEGTGFDFNAWANSFINNITTAIAENWAKGITDTIMDWLGIGSSQEVRTMNVRTLNVMGGTGGAGGGTGGGFIGAIGNLLGFGGGGGGGGGVGGFISGAMSFLGGFMGFAKGGVPGLQGAMGGNLTSFAKGGVLGGPTLFGLAGEKGKEGVMPLERVGGKLGVNAQGMGGDHFSISIQAVDTQTGAQFIERNADQIMGQLMKARMLGTFR